MSIRISNLPAVLAANILDTDILPIVTGVAAGVLVTDKVLVSELRVKLGGFSPAFGGRTVTNAATYTANNAVYNIKDFGAVADSTLVTGVGTDNTAFIQAALTAANAAGGGRVYIPKGYYRVTSPLNIFARTTLFGEGKQLTSVIFSDHTGDGIRSTWPINSSTGAFINLRDFSLITPTNANTGGGFVDVGGSYVWLLDVYIQAFGTQVIFDQTEVGGCLRCDLECLGNTAATGVWLLNGAEHTVGANQQFTNHILVEYCQINANGGPPVHVNIRDDGGVMHVFRGNNLNAGGIAIYACHVKGLTIEDNSSEGHTPNYPFVFDLSTFAGAFKGWCEGVTFKGNSVSDVTPTHLQIFGMLGGEILANAFIQHTTAAINFASDLTSGVVVEGNSKTITGAFRTPAKLLNINGVPNRALANAIRQKAMTYVAAGIGAGAGQVITPAAMGELNTSERIVNGQTLLCVNADGSNAEYVVVTAVGGATFTATFASAKAANWLVLGF